MRETVVKPVEAEFDRVNHEINSLDASNVPLINQVAQYLLAKGGKRLRPLVLLLSAKACGYEGDANIPIATAIELIHGATLLHDDVVDGSELRRNQPSAHIVWNNSTSILVGDFLYSQSFQLIVKHCDNAILQRFASATKAMAEGEITQLSNRYKTSITESKYFSILENKTGKLFELAAESGAMLATEDAEVIAALQKYGRALGIAFQIMDDALDYTATSNDFGKNTGDDLCQGIITLPLIYALQKSDNTLTETLKQSIKSGKAKDKLNEILKLVKDSGTIEACHRVAQQIIDDAITELHILPDSESKSALTKLAQFAIARDH